MLNITPTWQHIDNAKQLMTALALVEAQGNGEAARHARAKMTETVAHANAEAEPGGRTMTVAEGLATYVKHDAQSQQPADRYMAVIWMAALALELGLEPDEQARAEAQQLIGAARGGQAPEAPQAPVQSDEDAAEDEDYTAQYKRWQRATLAVEDASKAYQRATARFNTARPGGRAKEKYYEVSSEWGLRLASALLDLVDASLGIGRGRDAAKHAKHAEAIAKECGFSMRTVEEYRHGAISEAESDKAALAEARAKVAAQVAETAPQEPTSQEPQVPSEIADLQLAHDGPAITKALATLPDGRPVWLAAQRYGHVFYRDFGRLSVAQQAARRLSRVYGVFVGYTTVEGRHRLVAAEAPKVQG